MSGGCFFGGIEMKKTTLERLMIMAIRAFQEEMMSTRRSAEIRNISAQEGTGSGATGWKDAVFKIDYVENEVYHECYIRVKQNVVFYEGNDR